MVSGNHKIKGPYLPIGETDWMCVTCDTYAVLKDLSRMGASNIRKDELYCPNDPRKEVAND